MQQLKNVIKPRKRFWRRQFQSEATKSQKIFDWFFGAVLPVVCFVFDPLVFKGGVPATLLGEFKPFAYLLSFVSVMAMAAFLIWGAKLKWLNAILAGLFLVGGLISFGVGLAILPYSVMGLCWYVFIGALGFTPFFSSIVFLRNAFRAFQAAKPFLDKKVLIRAYVLSAIFSLIAPAIINLKIQQMLDEMKTADAQTMRANFQILKYVAPIVDSENLVFLRYRFSEMENTEKVQIITEGYEQMTGINLEENVPLLTK